MTCEQAAEHLSALYDRETVPSVVAKHAIDCSFCRDRLQDYAEQGLAMRLHAASMNVEQPALFQKPERVPRASLWDFLRTNVNVPRFAMALLVTALLAASARIVVVRAQPQTPALWFQFQLEPPPTGSARYLPPQHVERAGYDDGMEFWQLTGNIIAAHVALLEVSEKKVEVAIQARRIGEQEAPKFNAKKELNDLASHHFTYVPGQTLDIPVEGGGDLQLVGHVSDHQPRFAWGLPAEPGPEQLVVTSPILITGTTVLFNMQGANGLADTPKQGVVMFGEGFGLLTVALHPFPGAISAKASWGHLEFKFQGKDYLLLCGSQISGGPQPQDLWVSVDPTYVPKQINMTPWFLAAPDLPWRL